MAFLREERHWVNFFLLLLLGFIAPIAATGDDAFPPREAPPRLAVFPLATDKDPDYAVFMSDRLVDELMRHRDIPAWQGRWFELVEPDTLPAVRMKDIAAMEQAIKGDDLNLLRSAAQADRAMVGYVSHAGTRTLHVRLIDLATGEPLWSGRARDDEQWQWIYAQRAAGDIAMSNLMHQLGYRPDTRRGASMAADEAPLHAAFARLHTSQRALVGGYENLIRETMQANQVFGQIDVIPAVGARLGRAEREALAKAKGINAVVCGSMVGMGKDNIINAVAVALRLVEVPSGRILWASSSHAQRVWRHDDFDGLTQQISTNLVYDLTRARAGTRLGEWAELPDPEDGPGWVSRGMLALESGLLDQAEEAFLKAEKFEDSRIAAYEGLGRVYARRPALRQRALDYFNRAIRADSTRADLFYELASVYYDIGTEQCLTMARRALAIDPDYSPAYRLLGDWYARDEWYARVQDNAQAVAYYGRYMILEPGDADVAVRMARVLARMQDDDAIARYIAPFVQTHPEAIELLPIVAQRAQRLAQYDSARAYWTRYLERVDAATRSLYIDPAPVMLPAERARYERLPDADKQAVVDRFWQNKDQDPTTEVNERLLEHYRRVWMARNYYADSAYPFDTRGEVYVRYGEPDYRSRSGRAPGVMSAAVQQVKDRLATALYERPPEGALVGTVFPVRSSRTMMADQTSSIAANLAAIGDGFLPVTSGEDHSLVPWESWVYVTVGGGIELTFTDEMGSGNFHHAPPPLRLPPGMRSLDKIQEFMPELVYAGAVSRMPEQHRPFWETRDLPFYYDLAGFRGEDAMTRVNVVFGLPGDIEKTGRGDVTLAVALYDTASTQTLRMLRTVRLSDVPAGALLTDVLALDAPPGVYRLTVKAENPNAHRVGMFHQDVQVEAFGSSPLQMSDPVLAVQIGETDADGPFRRGDLRVVPLPTRSFLVGQDLGLYFEVYNLMPDAFGQVRYRVTLDVTALEQTEGVRERLTGTASRPEVSLTFEQVDDRQAVQVYQFMNLTQARRGRNRLTVTVEDVNANTRVTKETVFRYGE